MKRKYHVKKNRDKKMSKLAFEDLKIRNSFIRNLWADFKQMIKETK